MKYPNTKSWLFFWCSCFNFLNTLICTCFFWRLILVCSLLVRVLSSITLHSRCLSSFYWSNVFRSSWMLGLAFMMCLTIFRMMNVCFFHWFLTFGFFSRIFNCEKDLDFDENIDLHMMSMCLMFRVWSSNFFFLMRFRNLSFVDITVVGTC